MRLIDETKYQELLAKIPMNERTFRKAVEVAEDMPTIDAVPVVRCKDCAIQGKLNCPMDEWVKPDDNGFCHHGKRKDGD